MSRQFNRLFPLRISLGRFKTLILMKSFLFVFLWCFSSLAQTTQLTYQYTDDNDFTCESHLYLKGRESLFIIKDPRMEKNNENSSGTIAAGRSTSWNQLASTAASIEVLRILTPSGFIKTANTHYSYYSSGTTMSNTTLQGTSWNNTANVTSINFVRSSGNFTSGTRITVYARRTQ